jgi:hypothetical protein
MAAHLIWDIAPKSRGLQVQAVRSLIGNQQLTIDGNEPVISVNSALKPAF